PPGSSRDLGSVHRHSLDKGVAVVVRVARDRQLIADGLTINIRNVANLGDLPIANIKMTGVLAIQHVDNELTVRKNLLVTLNDDLASGGRVHVVVTEHELQRLSVTRLDQSQREGGAKLGLDGRSEERRVGKEGGWG